MPQRFARVVWQDGHLTLGAEQNLRAAFAFLALHFKGAFPRNDGCI